MKLSIAICYTLITHFVSFAHAEKVKFTTLKGSKEKVGAAYAQAVAQDLTFAKDEAQVQRMVDQKLLVALRGDENYTLSNTSHAWARPASELFVRRFAEQFRKANGQQLVVTSALRATDGQPWNASSKSVHPTGMAMDFRIPKSPSARKWIEKNLLDLQSKGVILATKERRPPHLHIVVLSNQYMKYVESKNPK